MNYKVNQTFVKRNPSNKTMESPTDQTKSVSIDEKNGKIKIVLDHSDNTYYSGQTIFGTIYLNYSEIRGK